jgi:hypothetical protein
VYTTLQPSFYPTMSPTEEPTFTPSASPTLEPTFTPSASPTLEPTFTPSASPTLEPTFTIAPTTSTMGSPTRTPSLSPTYPVTSFTAEQVINGIDSNTYYSSTTYQTSLQQSIAACMVGVNSTNVYDIVVSDIASSSSVMIAKGKTSQVSKIHVMVELLPSKSTTASSTASVNAAYKVSVLQTSSTFSYSSLSSQLSTAVSSGQFDTYLASYSSENDAVGFSGCTSTSVTTTNTSPNQPTYSPTKAPSDDDSSSNGLSDGAIAGIVIGTIVGVALIFGVVYYFLIYKDDSSGTANDRFIGSSGNNGGAGSDTSNPIRTSLSNRGSIQSNHGIDEGDKNIRSYDL